MIKKKLYLHFNSGHHVLKLNQRNNLGILDQVMYTVDNKFLLFIFRR